MSESYQCPFCRAYTILTDKNSSASSFFIGLGNKHGPRIAQAAVKVCSNPDCLEYSLSMAIGTAVPRAGGGVTMSKTLETWQLVPRANISPMPPYIPAGIVSDYKEACLIRDLSPKASATLARRCLQGMIRDFFGISKKTLYQEIEAIRDKIDPTTWESIDAIRKIGNVGAHMEKDIDVIVEVEPDEAQLLLELIESLIEDWYVERHRRQQRAASIKLVAAQKEAAQKGTSPLQEGSKQIDPGV